VAVVWSDTTANFYAGSGAQLMDIDTVRQKSDVGNLEAEFTGITEALLRSHIPFDVIDDTTLERESLQRYQAILLPNVACMSDRSAARLTEYVRGGGNLFSTFETSLYDGTGIHRRNYALGEVFGVESTGKIAGPMRWDFMKPAGGGHTLLQGLNRALVPSSIYHVRATTTGGQPLLHFTKPLAGRYDGLPEVSNEPALVVRRYEKGTSIYFSGDLGASIQGFHVPELLQLVSNAARDLSTPPITIDGAPGSVEVVVRSQSEGRRTLVHLVNFTGEMTRPIRSVVPAHNVTVTLPGDFRRAYTLVGGKTLDVQRASERESRVRVPEIKEYEVVVLEK
jgi:hypothetical protein